MVKEWISTRGDWERDGGVEVWVEVALTSGRVCGGGWTEERGAYLVRELWMTLWKFD